jgi:UDP-N-acetylglucosamine--N-acetylmuramyl-(pentapeptide) pyrophosphoryl-undecaprenol N-acetylglucosamine transferase
LLHETLAAKAEKMRAIITGGGTGGHLFPGIALATALQEQPGGCEILFIGTKRQLDQETLAEYAFQQTSVSCMGLKGKGLIYRLKSVASLPFAVLEAALIIRKFQPDLVVGVGGYVTGPVLLAARLLGVATSIHEQNSVPGLANRMIARFVDRIFVSIPCAAFPEQKTLLTGNPVREAILDAARQQRQGAHEKPTLLVLGGSLGAHRVNELMVESMALLQKQHPGMLHVIHQTGRQDEVMVRQGYEKNGVSAEVAPFFTDMAALYTQADFVVARAGATTLAELAVMGLPALLIPYPYAADDHQAKNGDYYVQGGGAEMYREEKLDAPFLEERIKQLLADPQKMAVMADNMKKMGKPEATRLIVEDCLQRIRKQ